MKSPRLQIGFPLLAKELTELANQKRTYVIRFLYAAVLFVGGLVAIYGAVGTSGADIQLGLGEHIFFDLVEMQFWLILIFLPATASGALTIEKERDSLAILLLTTMPPWSILLQKFLSRLLPMVSFLLLSFPLLAVAYSYGGVDTAEMIGSIVLLLLFAAEVCAVAIMCSAYCRTTTEAFLTTYFVLLLLYATCAMWPPHLFAVLQQSPQSLNKIVGTALILVGGVIVLVLFLGRVFLQTRAFLQPRNVLLQFFQWLDGIFFNMNEVTGGIVLIDDSNSLPQDTPVAWRETAKKSLGTFRYLFRVCTAIEVPILFVGSVVDVSTVRQESPLSLLLFILWGLAAALICVHASGVITAERSRQTLDALLTTPMSGEEILIQKMAGVRRLIVVLWVPFGSIFAFQLWFRGFDFGYLFGSLLSAAVLLPLVSWLAMAIGLRIRSTMKAVLFSVGTVVGVCLLPFLIGELLLRTFGHVVQPIVQAICCFSPAAVISMLEQRSLIYTRTSELAFWLTLSTLFLAAGAAWWIRRDCLRRADVLLERVPSIPAAEQVKSINSVVWTNAESPVAAAEPV